MNEKKNKNVEISGSPKSFKNFFEKIHALNGISPLWEKVLSALKKLDPSLTDCALDVLCVYFSLLDDGNTCIPLDKNELMLDWLKKWNGLLLVAGKSDEGATDKKFFYDILGAGLLDLKGIEKTGLPFEIFAEKESGKKYLFAKKYFLAKTIIEDRIKKLFTQKKNSKWNDNSGECERIKKYFFDITSKNSFGPIKLKDAQAQAIVRGQKENLIITGGPGTGKTTVVCYLLWELLKNPECQERSIYLAAPSGKAADRLKESVSDTLEKLDKEERERYSAIFEKINSAQAFTVHRLLSYNPAKNDFSYNSQNQFLENSIFVIDESSMIDITLFASLLEAIPDKARVYILGDKDQLPSVQAGAVLGELLAKKTESVVELVESNRFNDNSMVGALKNAMQKDIPLGEGLKGAPFKLADYFCAWNSWKEKNAFCVPPKNSNENPVVIFNDIFFAKSQKEKQSAIEEMTAKWSESFYDSLAAPDSFANEIDLDQDPDCLQKSLDKLWSDAVKARILCAERDGEKGVVQINKNICARIAAKNKIYSAEEFFTGELLMISKNQAMFNLYNGDSGIVVTLKAQEGESLKYLMVKKDLKTGDGKSGQSKTAGIVSAASFVFYPLYLLPMDAIDVAYAITIHKSQGSGYNAILIFVPEKDGHPLLNRQIVYTAITRAQGSTYMAATEEILNRARQNCIERRAMINL